MFFFLFSLTKCDNCVILRKQTHALEMDQILPMWRGDQISLKISEIFTFKFVFWKIVNWQLVYFIP